MADKKKCFVVSPIGGDNSPQRLEADWFLQGIVRPALESEFVVERADDERKAGIITTQIIVKLEEADLIVADLSDHNPNVLYELGVAHTLGKPVIPMIRADQDLPFDNRHIRTIFYSRNHPDDLIKAVNQLKTAAQAELSGQIDNPVKYAVGLRALSAGDEKDKMMARMADQVAGLEAQLTDLRRRLDATVVNDPAGLAAAILRQPHRPNMLVGGLGAPVFNDVGHPSLLTEMAAQQARDSLNRKGREMGERRSEGPKTLNPGRPSQG